MKIKTSIFLLLILFLVGCNEKVPIESSKAIDQNNLFFKYPLNEIKESGQLPDIRNDHFYGKQNYSVSVDHSDQSNVIEFERIYTPNNIGSGYIQSYSMNLNTGEIGSSLTSNIDLLKRKKYSFLPKDRYYSTLIKVFKSEIDEVIDLFDDNASKSNLMQISQYLNNVYNKSEKYQNQYKIDSKYLFYDFMILTFPDEIEVQGLPQYHGFRSKYGIIVSKLNDDKIHGQYGIRIIAKTKTIAGPGESIIKPSYWLNLETGEIIKEFNMNSSESFLPDSENYDTLLISIRTLIKYYYDSPAFQTKRIELFEILTYLDEVVEYRNLTNPLE